jgi:steroid delta-isomerase-like uncharacterized protein
MTDVRAWARVDADKGSDREDPNVTEHLALLRRHMNAENAHDLAATLATLTRDCVFTDTALGRTFHGHDGAAAYYRMWWHAFEVEVSGEDLHWTSTGLAVAETRFRGRQIGSFLGVPSTGRQIDVPFVIIVGFRDGLMNGERFYWNLATLLTQVGTDRIPTGRSGDV